MDRRQDPAFNSQIYQRACEWFVEFRSHQPEESARRAFYQWLRESPQHIAAYLHLTAVWHEGPALGGRQDWTAESLIADAVNESNVVALEPSEVASQASTVGDHRDGNGPRPARSWWLRSALAACMLLALLGLSMALFWEQNTIVTATGEQRFISLPDGSTVTLNSRSKLRVRTFERERIVELQEGQALFSVAKDPSRPFVVISGSTRVRAVGTQFDVYRKRGDTIVTVVEGRVAVRRKEMAGKREIPQPSGKRSDARRDVSSPRGAAGSAEELLLSAGQQLLIAANGSPQSAVADVARATSWTQRQLIFESTPLAEVVDEFNRYNPRQMTIASVELNTFQIDGVFASTDPGSLIRFLRTRPGVQVTETDAGITIERR